MKCFLEWKICLTWPHETDRTPIFKIIRASIFCAYAGLQITDLHRGMRKIAWSDYPFKKSDKEEQAKAEIRFMKRLASVMTVPDHCMIGRSVVTHLTSTRLRDCYTVQQRVRTILI